MTKKVERKAATKAQLAATDSHFATLLKRLTTLEDAICLMEKARALLDCMERDRLDIAISVTRTSFGHAYTEAANYYYANNEGF